MRNYEPVTLAFNTRCITAFIMGHGWSSVSGYSYYLRLPVSVGQAVHKYSDSSRLSVELGN